MKHTVTGYVFMENNYTSDYSQMVWTPRIWAVRVRDENDRVFIGAKDFEVEVPDDWNPVPHQVAALEAEKRAALEKYQRDVASINDRLSKLLALESA